MNLNFDLKEIASAFTVLFVIIDIIGAIPIIISLKEKQMKIEPAKTSIYSLIILTGFLFIGQAMLAFFNVDISSFAVAGAIILFVLAVEMIFNVELFKNDGAEGSTSTFVPLVFPLIAGAASFTTLLSLRAEFETINIICAVALNMLIVFLVLKHIYFVEKIFGKGGIYVMRKFFGVILLAVAVKLFTANLTSLINSI